MRQLISGSLVDEQVLIQDKERELNLRPGAGLGISELTKKKAKTVNKRLIYPGPTSSLRLDAANQSSTKLSS